MTTISNSIDLLRNAMMQNQGRHIVANGKSESVLGPARAMTGAEKAERAQREAQAAATVAAADKRMQEAEKNKTVENNGIYTPDVSTLSLENAQKNLGFAQLMIERHEDVGSTFHGRYGDTELKSAKEWEAALKDYIGKQQNAASMYSKVQEMS